MMRFRSFGVALALSALCGCGVGTIAGGFGSALDGQPGDKTPENIAGLLRDQDS